MEFTQAVLFADEPQLAPDIEAFLERVFARCVRTEQGCLIWQRCITKKTGYSRIGYRGDVWLGHRLVYALAVRALKPDEHVDHRCHNADTSCTGGRTCAHRRCLEPSHLEAVSQPENNRRAREHATKTPGARFTGEQRGTCKKGLHPWVPENIVSGPRGTDACRACKSDRQQAYDLKTRGPGTLSQRPVNPVWATLGLEGCRECGSNQNGHRRSGLCYTCCNRRSTGKKKRQRQSWLAAN